jgi:hypothetical protein
MGRNGRDKSHEAETEELRRRDIFGDDQLRKDESGDGDNQFEITRDLETRGCDGDCDFKMEQACCYSYSYKLRRTRRTSRTTKTDNSKTCEMDFNKTRESFRTFGCRGPVAPCCSADGFDDPLPMKPSHFFKLRFVGPGRLRGAPTSTIQPSSREETTFRPRRGSEKPRGEKGW